MFFYLVVCGNVLIKMTSEQQAEFHTNLLAVYLDLDTQGNGK